MRIASDILGELRKMFMRDLLLTVSALMVIALAWAIAAFVSPDLAGLTLAVGSMLALAVSVFRPTKR